MNETQIHPGQRWRSLDKRDNGRTVVVETAPEGHQYGPEFVTVRSVRLSTMRVRTLWSRYELVSPR